MKIKEEWKYDHDKGSVQIKKVHDTSGVEHRARVLRDTIGEEQKGSEHKLVGTIPTALIAQWIQEAGIDWSDNMAVQEVVKRKILSGEFDKFRVWKGKY